MELNDVPTRFKTRVMPFEEVRIMPVGDIQLGAPGCDTKRLRAHIKWGVEHDVLWLGTGDYTDFLSPSNRRFLKNAGLYDTANDLIDRWHREHMDEVKDILAPTKGQWIGLHEGHHFHEYGDGTTCDTDLAQYLDAPFLGTCAVSRLKFRGANHRSVDCLIWSHHGEGGGMDPLRRLVSVAPGFPQVDIFVQGHNTQLGSRKFDNVWFYGDDELKMRSKDQMFVAAGGWMQGYNAGSKYSGRAQGSYVEKGMMRPTAIGGALITVTPRHKAEADVLDIKCSV